MSAAHDDERPQAAPPQIPGAWLKPAAAFADESHVVRPDRRGGEADKAKLVRLSLLAVVALGVAVFSWRVTVSLKAEEDPGERPSFASAAAPGVASKPRPVEEAEALPAQALRAVPQEPVDEVPTEPQAPEILVPPPDPSFPTLPAVKETQTDRPARARPASRDDDDDDRSRRVKRRAKQSALDKASERTARRKAAREATAPAQPQKAAAAAQAPEPAAETPASITREAEKLFSSGDLPAARALVERALAQNAGYARAHRTLAVICAKQGDAGCARKGYETYLKLAPEAADAPDVRRILGM